MSRPITDLLDIGRPFDGESLEPPYLFEQRAIWPLRRAVDGAGNIGIGYSFGGPGNYVGQRFAGRASRDPLGQLTLGETVLAEGQGSQNAMRWEDYSQTAIDPSDDCTIWYVGDYLKKGETNYTSKIAGLRLPGCR